MQFVASLATGPTPPQMELWQYGVLGVACAILIAAVIHLYKDGRRRDRQHAAARKAWDDERVTAATAFATERGEHATKLEAVRAAYEAKRTELAEQYAQALREDRNTVRREFADLMEKVVDKNAESTQATANILEKLYGRLAGTGRPVTNPRSGRY